MDASELRSFLARVVNENLDDAGILADWLEENGEVVTGRLLRLRWKRYRTEYERARNRDEQDERRIAGPWHEMANGIKVWCQAATTDIVVKVTWRRAEVSECFRRYINRVTRDVILKG